MDWINAAFEAAGALALWPSIAALLRDKQIRGMSIWSTAFFACWGWWNIIYYPYLSQTASAWAAAIMALSNSVYLGLLWRYRRG